MTSMEERESAFENKFAHDEELKFRVEARRTKLIGNWAAGVMGMKADEAQRYVETLLAADLQEAGSDDVLRKLTQDLTAKGLDPVGLHLRKKMDEFYEIAKSQVVAG